MPKTRATWPDAATDRWLQLIFLIATRAVALLGLSRREWWWKDAEILMLRHRLAVAQREWPRAHSRLTWADGAGRSSRGPRHMGILALDFFTADLLDGTKVYVLAAIEHGIRRVRVLGATGNPVQSRVVQQARTLLMDLDDEGMSVKFVLHDRDACFTAARNVPGSRGQEGADVGLAVLDHLSDDCCAASRRVRVLAPGGENTKARLRRVYRGSLGGLAS